MTKMNEKIKLIKKYIWGIYTATLYLKINLLKKLSLKRSVLIAYQVLVREFFENFRFFTFVDLWSIFTDIRS